LLPNSAAAGSLVHFQTTRLPSDPVKSLAAANVRIPF